MKFNFIHIPKTAGLTFYYFLEECFGSENCFRAGDKDQVINFHRLQDVDYLNKFTVVSGHLKAEDLIAKKLIRKDRLTIAFVRSPLEREISAFKYYLATPNFDRGDQRPPFFDNTNLIDFYFSKNAVNSSQSSYIGHFSTFNELLEFIKKWNIFVFPLEQINPVSKSIQDYANVLFFPSGFINKSNKENLSIDELEYLTKVASNHINQESISDLLLHEYALKYFNDNFSLFNSILFDEKNIPKDVHK